MDTNDIIVISSSDGTNEAASEKLASAQDAVEKEVTETSDTEDTDSEETSSEADEQDEADSNEESDQEGSKPKRKSGAQRNREKVARLEQELNDLRRQVSERQAGEKPPADESKQAASTKSDEGKPDPGQFETHAEYIEALTEWKLDQREKAREEKAKSDKAKEQIDSSVSSFRAKAKEFLEKTKDFAEVLEDVNDIKMSGHLQSLFLEIENGPEVMYELAKNREEYKRINALSLHRAGIEIGKIVSRIESSKETKAAPKTITKTKAPPPISPVGGGGVAIAKSIHDPNISFGDYERLRKEQMKRK